MLVKLFFKECSIVKKSVWAIVMVSICPLMLAGCGGSRLCTTTANQHEYRSFKNLKIIKHIYNHT